MNGSKTKNQRLYLLNNIDKIIFNSKWSQNRFFIGLSNTKLLALKDVGLEYVQLGQSSNTLSGGEAQRIKLASFLCQRKSTQKKLFIFDEPTTGLHFHDVQKLIKALNDLVEMGHHVIIIEHNLDIIKSADWIIDLGKEGGNKGGDLLFQGTLRDFVSNDVASHTKEYLKRIYS